MSHGAHRDAAEDTSSGGCARPRAAFILVLLVQAAGEGCTFSCPDEERGGLVFRSAASTMMRVGRATVFPVGFAVVMSVTVGLGSAAVAMPRTSRRIGKSSASPWPTPRTANVN